MFSCAKCRDGELIRAKRGSNVSWECPTCRGKLFGVGVLRKILPKPVVNTLWQAAVTSPGSGSARCPSCAHRMQTFAAPVAGKPLALDVCKTCYLIWFDDQELETLPRLESTEKELTPEAREAIANLEIAAVRSRADWQGVEGELPESTWQAIPALLRLPVEQESEPLQRRPWLTILLVALTCLVSGVALVWHPEWIDRYGLIPEFASRYGGLTFLTSFFLHADVWHLLGNMYFLAIFGDNVEDYLGRVRYALLLVLATICGGVLEVVLRSHGTIPLIGASGGISGVIAFYALNFPQARLGFLFYYRWVTIPASWAFCLWVGMQLLGFFSEWRGQDHVAYLAHLSGVVVGVVFWLAWRKQEMGTFRGL